jgi:hypothetical protein
MPQSACAYLWGNARVSFGPILEPRLSARTVAAERSPTLRSRVTNGSQLLANVDGRTAEARRYRDLVISFADDLGGVDKLTEADKALCRQAAASVVAGERCNGDRVGKRRRPRTTLANDEHHDATAGQASSPAEARLSDKPACDALC